jgi:hypothetical protein
VKFIHGIRNHVASVPPPAILYLTDRVNVDAHLPHVNTTIRMKLIITQTARAICAFVSLFGS